MLIELTRELVIVIIGERGCGEISRRLLFVGLIAVSEISDRLNYRQNRKDIALHPVVAPGGDESTAEIFRFARFDTRDNVSKLIRDICPEMIPVTCSGCDDR